MLIFTHVNLENSPHRHNWTDIKVSSTMIQIKNIKIIITADIKQKYLNYHHRHIQDPQKEAFGAKTGPFGAPGGPEEAQYQAKVCGNHDSNPVGPICGNWDQIWAQVWPPELFSQLGPVLGQKGPLGPPVSTYKAPEWANMTYNYVSYPWVVF